MVEIEEELISPSPQSGVPPIQMALHGRFAVCSVACMRSVTLDHANSDIRLQAIICCSSPMLLHHHHVNFSRGLCPRFEGGCYYSYFYYSIGWWCWRREGKHCYTHPCYCHVFGLYASIETRKRTVWLSVHSVSGSWARVYPHGGGVRVPALLSQVSARINSAFFSSAYDYWGWWLLWRKSFLWGYC